MIVDRLGAVPLVLQIPIGNESDFLGVVDLIGMRALTWRGETQKGEDYAIEEIPAELAEQAAEYREKLIEALADLDDAIAMKYLEGQDADDGRTRPALRATIAVKLVPVLAGAASATRASTPCSTRWSRTCRRRSDVPPLRVDPRRHEEGGIERRPRDNEPFAALAFKIAMDEGRKVIFMRVFSGPSDRRRGAQRPHGQQGEDRAVVPAARQQARGARPAVAGEIVAAAGLKDTTTGDTMCDPANADPARAHRHLRARVISRAIEADNGRQGAPRLRDQQMTEEDPTFRVRTDDETGQTIIRGMGELHLEIIVDRMKREYGVQARVGKPQVVYRETISKLVETG